MIDDDREWLELDECAKRMDITRQQVLALVRTRALRSINPGFTLLVEPAILG
jgi:predicted DNA-binding protein (UPF0251 family)